jgi:HTH-type transcriptional regulator/antitoxin HipB
MHLYQYLRYSADMKESVSKPGKKDQNMHHGADLLAVFLGARRRALELTQEDLSDISGVSLRLIHELEHGKETVRLANLIKILSSLGVHLELRQGASEHVVIDQGLSPLTRSRK